MRIINIIGITTDSRAISMTSTDLTRGLAQAAGWLTDTFYTTRGQTPFVRFFVAAMGDGPVPERRWELTPMALDEVASAETVTVKQLDAAQVTVVRRGEGGDCRTLRVAR